MKQLLLHRQKIPFLNREFHLSSIFSIFSYHKKKRHFTKINIHRDKQLVKLAVEQQILKLDFHHLF